MTACTATAPTPVQYLWYDAQSVQYMEAHCHHSHSSAKRKDRLQKWLILRENLLCLSGSERNPPVFLLLWSHRRQSPLHRYMRLPCEGHPEQKQPVHSPGNNSRFLFLVRYRSHEKTPLFFSDRTVWIPVQQKQGFRLCNTIIPAPRLYNYIFHSPWQVFSCLHGPYVLRWLYLHLLKQTQ